jgi:putative transposase
MKAMHDMIGISRQALHQYNHWHTKRLAEEELLITLAHVIREDHPGMGCRTMHDLMVGIDIGRDRCEQILLANGLAVRRTVNHLKTTVPQRIYLYPNLIKGLKVRAINELWQTDITYFITIGGKVFYIVFIIDVYSRRIVGHCAHDHMRAEANLFCLQRALALRKGDDLGKLIHHSDRGGQFVDKEYRGLLAQKGIRMSMCEHAQENAYTERVNGTIKNGYLKWRDIETLGQLNNQLNKAVRAYNEEKPHRNLPHRMSPINFENYLKATHASEHPTETIYAD